MTNKTHRHFMTGGDPLAWLLIAALAATTVAGCIQPGDDDPTTSADPAADLRVDRSERWTGEAFTLDGRNSTASEGEITRWVFDLGDGTEREGTNISRALIQHEYEQGGAYEVHFTIYVEPHGPRDGKEDTKDQEYEEDSQDASSTRVERVSSGASATLVVNERQELREQVRYAAPVDDGGALLNRTAQATHPFVAYTNATHWEADVHLRGDALMGAEVTVRVLDAENRTLNEENVTLEPEENWTIRLSGMVKKPGDHYLEIVVDSGGVRADGELRIYYEEGVSYEDTA